MVRGQTQPLDLKAWTFYMTQICLLEVFRCRPIIANAFGYGAIVQCSVCDANSLIAVN